MNSQWAIFREMLRLQRQGKLHLAGEIDIDVTHAADCSTWQGGECDCEPDQLEFRAQDGRLISRTSGAAGGARWN